MPFFKKKSAEQKAKPKIKRKGGNVLATIAGLLLLSAFVRLGDQAGQAIAREPDMPKEEMATSDKAESAPAAPAPDVQVVLQALKEREERVKESERQIRLRMAALEEADIEISKKLEELRQAEAALRETLSLADNAAESDITNLTAVYENMKPKEAAALFETMDSTFAAGFLGRMKPAAAAGIMAGLSPETAYSISVVLAGRNAQVPKD